MSVSAPPSFSIERLQYFERIESSTPLLVGVFLLEQTGRPLAFYSVPLKGGDRMDQAVVNETLTELRGASELRFYREALSGAMNVLRLGAPEPLSVGDAQSARVTALRILMESRPDASAAEASAYQTPTTQSPRPR